MREITIPVTLILVRAVVSFVHDIHLFEFFIILFILMMGSIGLKAFVHKKNLLQADKKFIVLLMTKWLIGLAMLVILLEITAWFAK
jgi:hypothetical protein